jgi:hypothetical protein
MTAGTTILMGDSITDSADRRSLARVFAYIVVTRVVLGVIGYWVVHSRHPDLQYPVGRALDHSTAIVGWLRWDVSWYLSIVDQGYRFSPHGESNIAFLPGLPALIALLKSFFGSTILAGLVAANISFVAAVFALWAWVRERGGYRAAERAVIVLLIYPLSFFFNTIYAEGLFFLFCTLALKSADRNQWLMAGLWATLATLTRPMGAFLVLGFAWPAFIAWRAGRVPPQLAAAVLLPGLGLGLWGTHTWVTYGSPFAVLTAQHVGWHVGHGLDLPWLQHRTDVFTQLLDVLQLFMPLVLLVLSIRAWQRLGVVSGIYSASVSVLLTLLAGDSLGREALAVVPAFAVSGFAEVGRVTKGVIAIFGLAMLLAFAWAFNLGRFMG